MIWQQTMTKVSFSFWINPEAMYDTTFRNLCSITDGTDYIGIFFELPNELNAQISSDGFTTQGDAVTTTLTTANQWYNIHVTYDSTLGSNQLKLYLDKTLVAQGTYTNSLAFNSTTIAALGKYVFDPDGFSHKGLIKDFRLWANRANSQTDVNNVGDNNSSAPTPDYWLKMEEGYGHPRTLDRKYFGELMNGATWSVQTPAPWVATSMTSAFWFYVPTTPATAAYIVSRGSTNSYAAYVDTDGKFKVQFFYFDGTNAILDSTVVVTAGWHRGMISHSKPNTISKIWLDGALKASNTKNDYLRDSGTTSASRFMLGAKSTGATTQSNYFGGNTKDVKIWNRQLTDAEALDDVNGEYVSPVGLIAEWEFDEDEHPNKAFDSIGYNTGIINDAVFDKDQLPFSLTPNYPYKDGVVDELLGYKTDGQQYLVIPELNDDFRITEPTIGGKTYEWVCKFSDFSKVNDNYMRLLQKADDFDGNYIQSIQVRDDGRVYLMYKINGVDKLARSVYPLKADKLYRLGVGVRYPYKAGTPLQLFRLYLNGFEAGLETTTEPSELPAAEDITDFHTYLFAGNEQLRGNYVGQVYSFRFYEEEDNAANMLGLMTNKFTTRQIDRGHVLHTT